MSVCVCVSVPHVIWDVATGLGGVVRKKSAGDGGVSVQKYIYLSTRALEHLNT